MNVLMYSVRVLVVLFLFGPAVHAVDKGANIYEESETIILRNVLCAARNKEPINGTLVIRYDEGSVARKREYRGGRLHGHDIRFARDGAILAEEEWKDGKEDGCAKYYNFPDHKLHKMICSRGGLLEGEYREWFPSGRVYKEGHFERNNKTGRWVVYAESGEITEIVNFENGIVRSEVIHYREADELFKFYNKKLEDSLLEDLKKMPKEAPPTEAELAESAVWKKNLDEAWASFLERSRAAHPEGGEAPVQTTPQQVGDPKGK